MINRLRRVRKMTYVVWGWCLLILAWCVGGASSATSHCQAAYQNACDTGAGIGVLLILFIGFFGFVFFSLIWFMTRPKQA
jgi:hypothetical protein